MCANNFIQNEHMLSNSMKNHECPMPLKDSLFSLNKNSHYAIKITPPKKTENVIDESKGYSQQSRESKVGKIYELKRKEFLRSSKKESP